jgi:hypothetical protein
MAALTNEENNKELTAGPPDRINLGLHWLRVSQWSIQRGHNDLADRPECNASELLIV